jgi:type VII secretion-associated serine protease mycosin
VSRVTVAHVLVGLLPALLAAGLLVTVPCSRASRADDIGTTARAKQWPLDAVRAPDAWRRSRGEGTLVAVLDTGVNPHHPDITGAVRQGPDYTGAGRSRHWGHHGTSMASIIAGRGHGKDRASGVLGVAPATRILSIRVTLENDDPRRAVATGRNTNALARGIRYAADQGADVISMSLGGGTGTWEGSAAEEEAVQHAIERGSVLVASCGNDGEAANRKNFPAAYPGVIAVGAVDEQSRVAPFSNRQNYLSVVAPGTRIVSADGSGSYVVGDGTSSAAAMVAGVVALIRSEYPDLSPRQVRRALERGTTRKPRTGHDQAYGHGMVDAALALEQAQRIAGGTRGSPAAGQRPGLAGNVHFGGGPDRVSADSSRYFVGGLLIVVMASLSVRIVLRRRHHRTEPAHH